MIGRCGVLTVLAACHAAPERALDAGAETDAAIDAGLSGLVVPWTTGALTIDGDWSEPDWNSPKVPLLVFADTTGAQARPYSEMRLLRDQGYLYVGMYAADEDIEASDFFQVTLGALDVRIDPRGHVTSSQGGIVAASDVDGTIDSPGDYDEEWVIEAQIPLEAIDLARGSTSLHGSRCDVTKDGLLHCGAVAATLIVAPASP